MGWLSLWLRQIGLFVFLAVLIQLILPPTSERQAARLVIGLVIILKILEPVGAWVTQSRHGAPWNVEMYFPRGDEYIEQGRLLAQETIASVKHQERQRVLDQFGAMITLTQGVEHAVLSFVSEPLDNGPWHVRVHLAKNEEPRSQVEDAVRRFLLAFLPESSRIDIVWESIAGR